MTIEVEFVETARYRVRFEAAAVPTEQTWFAAMDLASPNWETFDLEGVENRELASIRVVPKEVKDVPSV